jgi:hypothetical protein
MGETSSGSKFVNTELQNYIENRRRVVAGTAVHSPAHNALSETELNDMYGLTSPARSHIGQFTPRQTLSAGLQQKMLGSSSRFINEKFDMFALGNGGTRRGVIQTDYLKDGICDMRMKDAAI